MIRHVSPGIVSLAASVGGVSVGANSVAHAARSAILNRFSAARGRIHRTFAANGDLTARFENDYRGAQMWAAGPPLADADEQKQFVTWRNRIEHWERQLAGPPRLPPRAVVTAPASEEWGQTPPDTSAPPRPTDSWAEQRAMAQADLQRVWDQGNAVVSWNEHAPYVYYVLQRWENVRPEIHDAFRTNPQARQLFEQNYAQTKLWAGNPENWGGAAFYLQGAYNWEMLARAAREQGAANPRIRPIWNYG